ncbi:MAG TPA: hypothetical protein DDZ42_03945 [Candidatus Rokubacteria bacterium]|nr:MAG: hypothetical protein A2050_03635 [Candidatus Rokubacteria bacterium GWA2_73_35]HBH01069.1 hypothetical protein [Candidatus Rokubacteria bacterium]
MRSFSAALLVLVLLAPGPAAAQASFRVTHKVERTTATHTVLAGEVFNDVAADAAEVYVTAEALDPAGKRLAQGIAWVGGVRGRGSEPYTVRVPFVRGATRFRVYVSGFQLGFGRSEAP